MTTLPSRRRRAVVVAAALAVALSACTPATDTDAGASAPQDTEVSAPAQDDETGTDADQRAALDAYVATERAQLDTLADSLGDIYAEIDAEAVYPDTVSFSYRYAEPVDPAAASEALDDLAPQLQDLVDTQVVPAMTAFGLDLPPRVTYTYFNTDGSQLWTRTFG